MRHLTKGLVILGLLGLLASCVQVFEDEKATDDTANGTSTQATGEPILVGVLAPLSGPGAGYGVPAQKVMELAAKHVNEQGGVKGQPVKLVFEDSGCDGEPAKVAMEKLVSLSKVKYVLGGLCSSETLSAAPMANENKVVLLSYGSSNPKITQAGDFIFRNYPSDLTQGVTLAAYAVKKEYKKVGALVEEQPYTEGIIEAFEVEYKKTNGALVVEKYATAASDFRTQITKLQAAKVDVYFLDPQTPDKAELMLKQLQEAGVKGPFLMNDVALGVPKAVVEKYKDYVEGSVGGEGTYDKTHPELPKLLQEYKTLTNEDLPYVYLMAPAYDAVYIIKEALEKVGEDPVKVKDYLYTVKGRKGLAGELTFDANGDSNYMYVVRTMKGGVVQDLE